MMHAWPTSKRKDLYLQFVGFDLFHLIRVVTKVTNNYPLNDTSTSLLFLFNFMTSSLL